MAVEKNMRESVRQAIAESVKDLHDIGVETSFTEDELQILGVRDSIKRSIGGTLQAIVDIGLEVPFSNNELKELGVKKNPLSEDT